MIITKEYNNATFYPPYNKQVIVELIRTIYFGKDEEEFISFLIQYSFSWPSSSIVSKSGIVVAHSVFT
jgi:hypothetical protein